MTDVTFAMEAKSDQLNALDILGNDRVIRIRDVQVRKGDQPVSVFFDGDNNRPWKPSKGMVRIIAGCWGTDSKNWIGKSAQIYCDPTVIYAGKPVGGIRIRAMSDIDQRGVQFTLAISKQKREPYPVQFLDTRRPAYPAEQFETALPIMAAKMQSGEMTLQQVIARCQQTGDLTPQQQSALEAAEPKQDSH